MTAAFYGERDGIRPYGETSVNAGSFLKIRLKSLRSFKPLVIDLIIDRLSL